MRRLFTGRHIVITAAVVVMAADVAAACLTRAF
jgi:hypothetical protein